MLVVVEEKGREGEEWRRGGREGRGKGGGGRGESEEKDEDKKEAKS